MNKTNKKLYEAMKAAYLQGRTWHKAGYVLKKHDSQDEYFMVFDIMNLQKFIYCNWGSGLNLKIEKLKRNFDVFIVDFYSNDNEDYRWNSLLKYYVSKKIKIIKKVEIVEFHAPYISSCYEEIHKITNPVKREKNWWEK